MTTRNISDYTSISNTEPEEAATNIQDAKEFNVDPDTYAETKEDLVDALERKRTPADVSNVTADVATQSTQHASIVKKNYDELNWLEATTKSIAGTLGMDEYGDFAIAKFKSKSASSDLYQLRWKQVLGQKLTGKESIKRATLKGRMNELGKDINKFGYDNWESAPVDLGTILFDVGNTFVEHKELIATSTIGMGLLGAGLSGANPVVTGLAAARGFGKSSLVAGAAYATSQGGGEIYDHLDSIEYNGVPLADDEKRNLAKGGGAFMGLLTLGSAGYISKQIPWVRKIINPKAFLAHATGTGKKAVLARAAGKVAEYAQGTAMRQTMIAMGKSGIAEALEEGSQEAISILTKAIGESWDGTETNFLKGLNAASDNWKENLEQIGHSAALGFAGGSLITGAARGAGDVLGINKPPEDGGPGGGDGGIDVNIEQQEALAKKQEKVTNLVGSKDVPAKVKGTMAMHLMNMLRQHNERLKDTEIAQKLDEDLDTIRRKTYEDHGLSSVYVTKEELNAWADTEEKAAAVMKILGSEAMADSESNSPMRFDTWKFAKLGALHPDVLPLLKTSPEGQSAQQYLSELNAADEKRARLTEEIGSEPVVLEQVNEETQAKINTQIESHQQKIVDAQLSLTTLKQQLEQATDKEKIADIKDSIEGVESIRDKAQERINDLSEFAGGEFRVKDADIFGEDNYLEQPTFTEGMDKLFTANEILEYNEAQINTRLQVAEATNHAHKKGMDKITPFEKHIGEQVSANLTRAKTETKGKIFVVESFAERGDTIDPSSLSKEQQLRYKNDQTLKDRKVFSPDGMSIDAAVDAYAVADADTMLEVLAETPTSDEQSAASVVRSEAEQASVDMPNSTFEEDQLSQAYNNATKNHIAEMKILLDKSWTQVKKGIKKIALPLPKVGDLAIKAKNAVGRTRIKNLNPNQWKVGERVSQKKAINAILKNEAELAFREKEKAATNTQMAKETHIAIGKVNRANRFLAKLGTPYMQKLLGKAGKMYLDEVNTYLELYNFTENKTPKDKQSHINYVKKSLKEGKDVSIDPSVIEWLSTQENSSELTVDQILWIENRLRMVLKQANMKNRLSAKFADVPEDTTIQIIAEEVKLQAETHPTYDTTRNDEKVGGKTVWDKTRMGVSVHWQGLKNNSFIVKSLDANKLGGFFRKLLHQPLHEARLAKVKMDGEIKREWMRLVEKFSSKAKIEKMENTRVNIPEFEGTKLNPDIFQSELLAILFNMGSDGNVDAIVRYGISEEAMMKVLQRELTEGDFDIAQGVWDIFAKYKDRIGATYESTTGSELDFVQPKSIEAFGRTFRGGFYPLRYKRFRTDKGLQDQSTEVMTNLYKLDDTDPTQNLKGKDTLSGIVRNASLNERVDSNELVDPSLSVFIESVDELTHYINLAEPVQSTLKLVQEKTIKESIIAIGGQNMYTLLRDNIAEMTHSTTAEESRMHRNQKQVTKNVIMATKSAVAVTQIAFNPSSWLTSLLAIPNIATQMGPTAPIYIGKALLTMATNPFKLKEFFNFVAEIDPSVNTTKQGMDDNAYAALAKDMPKRRRFKNKPYRVLKNFQDRTTQVALGGILGGIDTILKTVAAVAAYQQYMDGAAYKHDYASVHEGKTKAQVEEEARIYVAALLESTTMRSGQLDKATLQKSTAGGLLSMYWNELRSNLNNNIGYVENVRNGSIEMVKHAKNGQYVKANAAWGGAAGGVASLAMFTLITNAMIDQIREVFKGEEEDDYAGIGETAVFKTFEAVATAFPVPVFNAIAYGVGSGSGRFGLPIGAVGDDLVQVGSAGISMVQMMLTDDLKFTDAASLLSDKQMRGVINTVSYANGGIPANAVRRFNQLFETREDAGKETIPGSEYFRAAGMAAIALWAEQNDNSIAAAIAANKQFLNREYADTSGTKTDSHEAYVDTVKNFIRQVNPLPDAEPLTQQGYDIIKHVESNGKWNARPTRKDGTPIGTAFGIYQFLKGTWRDEVVNTPEGKALGLTMDDRLSRKTKYQEQGMRIFTKYNVAYMVKNKVPISINSIYFTHHFGKGSVKQVYGPDAKDTDKLPKSLMTKKVLGNNNQLVKQGVTTIGDMKRYIKGILKRAEKR